MDKAEVLTCVRDAAEALAEFRHHLPQLCPAAFVQVEEAQQHLEYAARLLANADDFARPPGMRLAK